MFVCLSACLSAWKKLEYHPQKMGFSWKSDIWRFSKRDYWLQHVRLSVCLSACLSAWKKTRISPPKNGIFMKIWYLKIFETRLLASTCSSVCLPVCPHGKNSNISKIKWDFHENPIFEDLRNATIGFNVFVCLSACLSAWKNSNITKKIGGLFMKIWYLKIYWKSVEKINHVSRNSDKKIPVLYVTADAHLWR